MLDTTRFEVTLCSLQSWRLIKTLLFLEILLSGKVVNDIRKKSNFFKIPIAIMVSEVSPVLEMTKTLLFLSPGLINTSGLNKYYEEFIA